MRIATIVQLTCIWELIMPRSKLNQSKQQPKNGKVDNIVEEVDDGAIEDSDDSEEGSQITPKLVGKFIRMWPRAIFHTPAKGNGAKGKKPSIAKTLEVLDE